MAQNVTEADFQSEVLSSDVPVLVDFYADWCGPCRMLGPVLEELSAESAGAYKVVKVNTDENRDLAVKYGVSALPTLKVFKGGEDVETFVGIKSKAVLKESLS
jgi:thioredoxin 1